MTAPRLLTTLALLALPAVTRLDDAKARVLLDEVARAYKALPGYADRGSFVLTLRTGGKSNTVRTPAALALARPNKVKVDAGTALLFCDGSTLTTVVAPSKTFATEPAPKAVNLARVAESPVGSLLLGGPSGVSLQMVLGLLLGDDPARAVLDVAETLSLDGDRNVDGQACPVLRVDSASGTSYRLVVDPKTHLLRAIEATPDVKSLAALFPAGEGVAVESYRWESGPVTAGVPAAEAFAAELPKDFTKLGAPGARAAADEPKFRVQTLVDKPAPQFTLTLLDGAGKTRTVTLADLAGKVVVVDFWATWCGPCLAELPEVQKLIEGYAKAKKDVVVVALSQDDDPRDPIEVRKKVEKTLADKKLELTAAPVGKVGIDPSHSVGDAFQVEGYPTVVILDGKGVVRAAHVGFSPEVGKTLAAAVDALLAGKPVPKEKDKPAGGK